MMDATRFIRGIPAEYLTASDFACYYDVGYETSAFARLRSTGKNAVIENTVDVSYGKGFHADYARRDSLRLDLVSVQGGIPVEDTREGINTENCRVNAAMYGKQTEIPYVEVRKVENKYYNKIDDTVAGREKLLRFMQERIDLELASAFMAGYEGNVDGKLPFACRTVCGDGTLNYQYDTNTNLNTVLSTVFVADNRGDDVFKKQCMSVEHIRQLYYMAVSNKYGADRIEPASLEFSSLVDYPKYYLFTDAEGALALKKDPEYKELHLTIGRDLGTGQGSALTKSEYLGANNSIEVYHLHILDAMKRMLNGRNGVVWNALSWSFLCGAGAVGELLGKVIEIQEELAVQQVIRNTLFYTHGAGRLIFPIKNSHITEKTARNANITGLEDAKIEQGIIHSFTVNLRGANWKAL